ncbi:MAG TPA: lamin tail domain-containing protein [Phycisphaerae bacterium]|nr:lamin tail domain-containing protein [Phycisphaerae bacterium]
MRKAFRTAALIAVLSFTASHAFANIYITEFCSDTGNNEHFEFVEFTNLGSSPVDMTGWSEDDSNATPNKSNHSLSGLGTLAPGQSGIFTEATPATFRTYWGLAATVPVVGPYTNDNLSTTADSVTLFDSTGTLVDRLDYSTTNGGSADMVTRNAPLAALGKNDNSLWVNSTIGDAFGSFHAPQKYAIIGNPGSYSLPEPASLATLTAAALLLVRRKTR